MILYNCILNTLFVPVFLLITLISLWDKRLRKTWLQRVGTNKIRKFSSRPIWFHCSSLGEFNAIKNVIRETEKKYRNIFVTALTDTGYQAAVSMLGPDRAAILPLDFNFFINAFLKKLDPRLLVIEETELWPNLIYQTGKKGIPVIYTNCIISGKSFRFYRLLKGLFCQMLGMIRVFFIQNEQTGEYLRYLGVDKKKIQYLGNIKFDLRIPVQYDSRALRRKLFIQNELIFTAGSTREGEEEMILSVFKQLLALDQKMKLILAPRHLKRLLKVERLVRKHGFTLSRYSKPERGASVTIIDKMGVLLEAYAMSDITFIGGTFVPVGGHNPIEAAYFKKPVLCGPHIFKNREAFDRIIANKGGMIVKDQSELYKALSMLLKNKKQRIRMSSNAYKVIKDNQGASGRIARYITQNYIKGVL